MNCRFVGNSLRFQKDMEFTLQDCNERKTKKRRKKRENKRERERARRRKNIIRKREGAEEGRKQMAREEEV